MSLNPDYKDLKQANISREVFGKGGQLLASVVFLAGSVYVSSKSDFLSLVLCVISIGLVFASVVNRIRLRRSDPMLSGGAARDRKYYFINFMSSTAFVAAILSLLNSQLVGFSVGLVIGLIFVVWGLHYQQDHPAGKPSWIPSS